jgi:predicted NUDIX family phosphoesterase
MSEKAQQVERVLVVKESIIDFRDFLDGFYELNKFSLLDHLLSQAFFMDRFKAEKDPTHKQIIPYTIILRNNEIFCYKRTIKGGEKRLWGKRSLGIGGHLNPVDSTIADHRVTYANGLARELEEEAGLKTGQYDNKIKGLIYESENEVGKVHIGSVHIITIDGFTEINSSDPAISHGGFEKVENVLKYKDEFETWSQIVINHRMWE